MFGIQLAVHASMSVLLVYAAVEGWRDGGGMAGLLTSVIMITVFFACVVLHELGHSLTARRFGIQVPRILLMPIGGMAEFDQIPREPAAEFRVAIAGPLVNFAIVLVLWPLAGMPAGLPLHPVFEDSLRGLVQLVLYWNGLMGLFNLLPVFPMDGGRIFRALLATKLPHLRATWWAVVVGRILASGFIAASLWAGQYLLAGLFGFILFAGDHEYKLELIREREAAYWRELARRITPLVLSSGHGCPPLLPLKSDSRAGE